MSKKSGGKRKKAASLVALRSESGFEYTTVRGKLPAKLKVKKFDKRTGKHETFDEKKVRK
jgi:ribosomal protein L33